MGINYGGTYRILSVLNGDGREEGWGGGDEIKNVSRNYRIKDYNFGFPIICCLVIVRRVRIWSSGCLPALSTMIQMQSYQWTNPPLLLSLQKQTCGL